MPTRDPLDQQLGPADQAALRAYWRFYEAQRAFIIDALHRVAGEHSEWLPIMALLTPTQAGESESWEPYLASLHSQGSQLAHLGVSYTGWLELISVFRDVVRPQFVEVARDDLKHAALVGRGLDQFLDIVMARIGEAYIDAKQQLVARTEERYRLMFEYSPLPMWMFDRETLRFVSVNEAAIRHYGYTREEFAAMTLADLRSEADVKAMREDVAQAVGLAPARVWTHRTKDGSLIKVEISANDFIEGGRDVRLVLVNDVTQRELAQDQLRKTEEQLHQAQKMDAIGRLAGGVAHDFNNVLTVIESYACMLEETLDPSKPEHADVVEIRRAAQRAAEITKQLLAVSRHSVFAPRPINLDDIVMKYGSMLRRLVGERITVVIRRGDVPTITADLGRVEQVLLNLAVNARDAMPEGGHLTVETHVVELDAQQAAARALKAGAYVVLAVTDSGTGMDAETQARIFEPFFTTKGPGKGTGLGLSIVHGIVSQAGGSISVYSEPGHGTTFRAHFPIADADAQPIVHAPAAPPRRLPGVTVLVVDDHAEVREVAARILTEAGCRVLEASSAAAALSICVSHEGSIDLGLIDLVLRDARGDALLHQLRELRPGIQAVFMSGYPAGALTANGAPPGHFLEKPFSPTALRAAVACALGTMDEGAAGMPTDRPADTAPVPRVLIADDDEQFRRGVARLVAKSGFDVIEASDGKSAMARLEHEQFDAVLSDVQMPGMTGLELLRFVRRVDLDVPVILMSGAPDVASAAAALEYGAFRYLTKPLESASLTSLLRQATRAHTLARIRREATALTGATAGAADRAGLEVRFEQALAQLWMASQPIVHAESGALFGCEVLVRSRESAMSSPLALLDAATQLKQLPRLGRRVRTLSAALLAARTDAVPLFVNLHPADLFDDDLLDHDAPLSKLAPRVILEITERAALHSSPELGSRVARLRELGFRLAVDDIGAGYSGLTTFAELVPEIVKIDMSLVRNVHQSALKQRTIQALCRLCHDSGCLVVAEGIETTDERECVTSLGCDLLQGYLLGRPT